MSINLKSGVIALIGDEIEQYIIKNFAHKIDLYIKYGNNSTKPIQIHIDKKRWREISDEKYYIELLYNQETERNAEIYDSQNHKKIKFYE